MAALAATSLQPATTNAAPACTLTAADLISFSRKATLSVVGVQSENSRMTLELSMKGASDCLAPSEIHATVDQAAARSLSTKPIAGDAIEARGVVAGSTFKIEISSKPDIIRALRKQWDEKRTLEPFIKPVVSLRLFADYRAMFEVANRSDLVRLASALACEPVRPSTMFCDEFADRPYQQLPECLEDPVAREAVGRSFETDDPFVTNRDPRIQVWAIDKNLCFFKATRTPWVLGLTRVIFAGQSDSVPELGKKVLYTQFSSIDMKVPLLW